MRLATVFALIAAACCGAPHALAQWKWVDADGRVTYSDMPPPPGAKASRVTIRPDTSNPAPAPPPANAAGGSVAERAAGFEARRQEREATQRRVETESRDAETLERACAQLRGSLRNLESGLRVSEQGADGEVRVVDADERAKRAEEIRQAIGANCGGR